MAKSTPSKKPATKKGTAKKGKAGATKPKTTPKGPKGDTFVAPHLLWYHSCEEVSTKVKQYAKDGGMAHTKAAKELFGEEPSDVQREFEDASEKKKLAKKQPGKPEDAEPEPTDENSGDDDDAQETVEMNDASDAEDDAEDGA